MDVQRNIDVRMRAEVFGGVCYVPHRDDFFAVDLQIYALMQKLTAEWMPAEAADRSAFAALAKLGLCRTRHPQTRETSYSGPSFVGMFREIVTVPEPLVVNCFCTAFCPLKCIYCHADDLMQGFRKSERPEDVDNVAATASLVPAMVAVITGGDPLTRPERAVKLIDRLAAQKAIVLDTSGVGDIGALMDSLKTHKVHVRVSLDAVSTTNRKLRPPNKAIVADVDASFQGARRTIESCLAQGVAVTVQTVITARNDDATELRNLRDWLVDRGVRHWVLHVAVRGGSARRIEEAARRSKRPQGILPTPLVYGRVKALIDETTASGIALDIRCTDTDNTPNSVLLIGSNGDLYTEGLAHNGKVRLFEAAEARPDLIKQFWHHVDAFGHARRYLNWSPRLYEGQDLEDLCYAVPTAPSKQVAGGALVEIEAKYRVLDISALLGLLNRNGVSEGEPMSQRDEYYDTDEKVLDSQDFVLRVRIVDDRAEVCLKGARFRTPQGEYSRIELELPVSSAEDIRAALGDRGLRQTWFFEKRRAHYRWTGASVRVMVDEVPEIGHFVEIEGPLSAIREVAAALQAALGNKESRNYQELFLAHKAAQGVPANEVEGAEFLPQNKQRQA